MQVRNLLIVRNCVKKGPDLLATSVSSFSDMHVSGRGAERPPEPQDSEEIGGVCPIKFRSGTAGILCRWQQRTILWEVRASISRQFGMPAASVQKLRQGFKNTPGGTRVARESCVCGRGPTRPWQSWSGSATLGGFERHLNEPGVVRKRNQVFIAAHQPSPRSKSLERTSNSGAEPR